MASEAWGWVLPKDMGNLETKIGGTAVHGKCQDSIASYRIIWYWVMLLKWRVIIAGGRKIFMLF